MVRMDESLVAWLDGHADNLDADTLHADALPDRLAQAGLFAVGGLKARTVTGAP